MGFDYMALALCQVAQSLHGDFGKVLTLGRQEVRITNEHLRRLGIPALQPVPDYCEQLLMERFGAEQVDALDASDYEGATLVADLNEPSKVLDSLISLYDVVLDFGTLEHVFDVRRAFDAVGSAIRVGGIEIHLLPANQECGHGLYQFSPEFFFSYFSPENGYASSRFYLVEPVRPEVWYELEPPILGERLTIRSRSSVYIAVIAQKMESIVERSLQQSDYLHSWQEHDSCATSDNRIVLGNQKTLRGGLAGRIRDTSSRISPARELLRRYRSTRSWFPMLWAPIQCTGKLTKISLPRESSHIAAPRE